VRDRLVGSLTYATALFTGETVVRFETYLQQVLAAMAADEAQVVDRIGMLPAAERQQVLETWNTTTTTTTAGPEAPGVVHGLVEAQAVARPDAIAVVAEGQALSYGALNARATRWRACCARRAWGPDQRVALCLERSLELVVGILAVLKAGGAYVPLDRRIRPSGWPSCSPTVSRCWC